MRKRTARAVSGALEIPLKRSVLYWRIVWLIPTGLFTLVAGAAFLTASALGTPSFVVDRAWVSIFIAVVAFVSAYDTLRVARLRSKAVRLDETGVLDRRIQHSVLPWSEIETAEVQTRADGRPVILGLWARRIRRFRKNAPFWNYFGLVYVLQALAWRYRFAPISIDLESLDAEPELLIGAVRRYWGEPGVRRIEPKSHPLPP